MLRTDEREGWHKKTKKGTTPSFKVRGEMTGVCHWYVGFLETGDRRRGLGGNRDSVAGEGICYCRKKVHGKK